MRTLHLHIGANKTATTAIQRQLRGNAAALARAGICHPLTGQTDGGAHHGLCLHFIERSFLEATGRTAQGRLSSLLESLAAETDGFASTVLSSESLFFFHRLRVDDLKALLALFDRVRVLVYLRRQDAYALSFYHSRIAAGDVVPSLREFCADWDLDYLRNALSWEALVGPGNVVVRPFLRSAWRGGSIVKDFFSRVGAARTGDGLDDERVNPSPPLPVLEVLRRTNRFEIEDRPAFRRRLDEVCARFDTPPDASYLTRSLQDELLARYRASNEALAERYWSSAEAAAFFGERVGAARQGYRGLSREQWAEVVARVWRAGAGDVATDRVPGAAGAGR